jgi:hypothetical protein
LSIGPLLGEICMAKVKTHSKHILWQERLKKIRDRGSLKKRWM